MNQHFNKSISVSQLTNKSHDRVIMLINIITPPYLLNLINNLLRCLPHLVATSTHVCTGLLHSLVQLRYAHT